jgi:TonB family protein
VSRLYHFDPLLTETTPEAWSLRKKLLVASTMAHVLGFVVIALLPARARSIEEPSLPLEIVLTAAMPKVPEFVPPAPIRRPPPQPKAEPKPMAREPIVEPAPVPAPKPEPARAELAPPPAAPVAPSKPKPVVQTNVFGGAAEGPPVVTGKTSRTVIAAFGDAVAPQEGVRRGRVAEVGFDTAPSQATTRRAAATGTVKSAAFDAQAAPAPAPGPRRERPVSALDAEVEILSKPKPIYTDEARRLRIEGDVVLKVTFEASGKLVVLGVVQGLGHGLDQAAIDAAKKIEFNPARRDGQPVDHTANLRVVFRLA